VFLNPITIFKKTKRIFKEISLYFFYKEQKQLMGKNGDLSLYNLFKDYLGNLYMVVNLQPELKLYNNDADLEREEKKYVANEVSKLLPMFEKYDTYELIRMKRKRFDSGLKYGYGIVIKYFWKEVGFWWLLWLAMFYSGLGYGIYYLITTYLLNPTL